MKKRNNPGGCCCPPYVDGVPGNIRGRATNVAIGIFPDERNGEWSAQAGDTDIGEGGAAYAPSFAGGSVMLDDEVEDAYFINIETGATENVFTYSGLGDAEDMDGLGQECGGYVCFVNGEKVGWIAPDESHGLAEPNFSEGPRSPMRIGSSIYVAVTDNPRIYKTPAGSGAASLYANLASSHGYDSIHCMVSDGSLLFALCQDGSSVRLLSISTPSSPSITLLDSYSSTNTIHNFTYHEPSVARPTHRLYWAERLSSTSAKFWRYDIDDDTLENILSTPSSARGVGTDDWGFSFIVKDAT